MWPTILAHHHPEDAERCVYLGRVPLCRRCSALWPLCFATLAVCFSRELAPAQTLELLALLLIPVLEFTAVHIGKLSYSTRRVWMLGLLAGVGAGRLFHRYLLDPSDKVPWILALSLGLPAAASAVYHEIGKKDEEL